MQKRVTLAALLLAVSWSSFGCNGESHSLGLGEPIFVHQAELKHGKLPGQSPRSGDTSDEDKRITSLELRFGVLRPGAPNLAVSGRTTGDAYAVAIRILELGSGYWLKPVGVEDPTVPGELTFELYLDAAVEIEPGRHTFAAVAFDKHGRPGRQYTIPVCVGSDVPDNLNGCNPETEPPAAVASLTWNADADLDLTIVGPDGKRYDRSNRFLVQDGEQTGGLDGDGVTGCLLDGRRRENFVWNEKPGSGTWLAYANLFDACGKAAVQFELTIHRRRRNEDGTFALLPQRTMRGEFVRAQANGGAGRPLYLGPIEF
jgi:hypothetical protein